MRPGPQSVEAVHTQRLEVHALPAEQLAAELQSGAWQMCVLVSQRCPPQNPTVDSQRGKQNDCPEGSGRQKYPGRQLSSAAQVAMQIWLVPPKTTQIAPLPHSEPVGQPPMQ